MAVPTRVVLARRRARRLVKVLRSETTGWAHRAGDCYETPGWVHHDNIGGAIVSVGRPWTLYDPGEGPFLDSEGREWSRDQARWGCGSPLAVTPEGSRCIACPRPIDYLDSIWLREEDGASAHEDCVQVVPVQVPATAAGSCPTLTVRPGGRCSADG